MFIYRKATLKDSPEIEFLMNLSINEIIGKIVDERQLEAAKESMGLDTQLVEDGSYFLVFEKEQLIGAGGYSLRSTLFGGDHTPNRSDTILEPGKDFAKIRAMYTHPDWIRKGVGSFILELSERKAKEKGFNKYELMATVSGIFLYEKKGYIVEDEVQYVSRLGNKVLMYKMTKETNE